MVSRVCDVLEGGIIVCKGGREGGVGCGGAWDEPISSSKSFYDDTPACHGDRGPYIKQGECEIGPGCVRLVLRVG